GQYFPRRDDPDKHEYYCASMLLLFKPWHQVQDLKGEFLTWQEALRYFSQQVSDVTLAQMSNIEHYHKCKNA
ncbi:uncharacterized protein LAESUDRAFT_615749, partial [Laetiporus sulphureus 93-53]